MATRCEEVPADYPHAELASAVAGTQPKLLLVAFQGKYCLPGDTSEDRWNDWKYSEYLVEQLAQKCIESKMGKRAHMTEEEIIAQYFERAVAAGGRYGTTAQLKWTLQNVAKRLGWLVPDVCKSGDAEAVGKAACQSPAPPSYSK